MTSLLLGACNPTLPSPPARLASAPTAHFAPRARGAEARALERERLRSARERRLRNVQSVLVQREIRARALPSTTD